MLLAAFALRELVIDEMADNPVPRFGWSAWREMATHADFCELADDNGFPACYELGIGPRSDAVTVTYVGKTCDLRRQMEEHGSGGSHLSEVVDDALAWPGANLYSRARRFTDGFEAEAFERRRLDCIDHAWNLRNNG